MKNSVFDFSDYKDYIRHRAQSSDMSRGYHGRLAKAARIHGSFLSKVLNSKVNLTPDQGADLCAFWQFSLEETQYFLGLVSLARAGSPNLRSLLERQLRDQKKEHEELGSRFKKSVAVGAEQGGLYYSVWYLMCVHLLVLVPEFRRVEKLSERLRLPKETVAEALRLLAGLGLVESEGGKWRCKETDVHLRNDSIWAAVHHANWHARTSLKLQEGAPQLLNYSSTLVIGAAAAARIKDLLSASLEEVRELSRAAPEEDLYFLGMNFYLV